MSEQILCPVWIGYLLASPVRRLFDNPEHILSDYVGEGMTVLDVGCAMGFFSIPMAGMTGPGGKVICIDLQEKMLKSLEKRAKKAAVMDRIELRTCSSTDLGIEDLEDSADFALAMAVVHETPDISAFLISIFNAVRPGGRLLIAEPAGHVTQDGFEETLTCARNIGFNITGHPEIKRYLTVLLQKPI